MADTRQSRDEQADNEARRQRERELAEARARIDEAEPLESDADAPLGDLARALDAHEYPVSAADLHAAHGDQEVEDADGWTTVGRLLDRAGLEQYDSAGEVRRVLLDQLRPR